MSLPAISVRPHSGALARAAAAAAVVLGAAALGGVIPTLKTNPPAPYLRFSTSAGKPAT